MKEKWVQKASGELVKFDYDKLYKSMFKAGANDELIKQICKSIFDELPDGASTKTIYKKAYRLLKASSMRLAGKYKLKTAILELGPSGYPFEEFVAQLFKFQGFETRVGLTLDGKCIQHEVDILAVNTKLTMLVECKHHGRAGYKSDVKMPLYVHSRFNDLVAEMNSTESEMKYECWIVTNTRFTSDAVAYGSCAGLRLMAWDYPGKGSLKERVELSGCYPITCLCTLTKKEKQRLMELDCVLCKQVLENPSLLSTIDTRKHNKVLKECQEILNMNKV